MTGYTHEYKESVEEGYFVEDCLIENKNEIKEYSPRFDKCAKKIDLDKYLFNK